MGKVDFREWIKPNFGSEVRQTPLMLLRSKLFLLCPAPHSIQIIGEVTLNAMMGS